MSKVVGAKKAKVDPEIKKVGGNDMSKIDAEHFEAWTMALDEIVYILKTKKNQLSPEDMNHLASALHFIQEGRRLAMDMMTKFEEEQISIASQRLDVYKERSKIV